MDPCQQHTGSGAGGADGFRNKLYQIVDDHVPKPGNKISIVGAGAVGMACTFSILTQGIAHSVAIVDVMGEKLKGEVMDLQHGSFFMDGAIIEGSTDYAVTAGSTLIVITAGARQKEGETRLSLVQRNVDILKGMVPQLMTHSPDAILLLVSNPVDILTHVAWKLSGLPIHKVIGAGTNLDSLRFRYLLSQELGTSIESTHGWIIGEHGDTSVPIWSGVNVAGVRLRDIDPHFGDPGSEGMKQKDIHKQVVDSAYDIIKLKGSTSWAIGLSVAQLCTSLLHRNGKIHAVSTCVKGIHGIQEEVFLSVPCRLGRNGIQTIIKQILSPEETAKLHKSAAALKEVVAGIKLS